MCSLRTLPTRRTERVDPSVAEREKQSQQKTAFSAYFSNVWRTFNDVGMRVRARSVVVRAPSVALCGTGSIRLRNQSSLKTLQGNASTRIGREMNWRDAACCVSMVKKKEMLPRHRLPLPQNLFRGCNRALQFIICVVEMR